MTSAIRRYLTSTLLPMEGFGNDRILYPPSSPINPPRPQSEWPIVTFTEPVTFHLNGEEVLVIPLAPAHTDGGIFIYFRDSDVLHTGDVIGSGWPTKDRRAGGNFQGFIDNYDIDIELAGSNTKIIPGHGPIRYREDVIAPRDVVVTVLNRIMEMIERGINLEEILAAPPTSDYDDRYDSAGRGRERFIVTLYEELCEAC